MSTSLGLVLYQEIRELRSLYIYIYIFVPLFLMTDWLIDCNDISTRLGLFYA